MHQPNGRPGHRLVEDVLRFGAEAARLAAADVHAVRGVEEPAEQLAVPEERLVGRDVQLVGGGDVGVVEYVDVSRRDARIRVPVRERVSHAQVSLADEALQRRPAQDRAPVFGQHRRVVVERVANDARAADAADRVIVLKVDVPEPPAQDLVGDRVDVGVVLARQGQACHVATEWRGHVGQHNSVPGAAGKSLRHELGAPVRLGLSPVGQVGVRAHEALSAGYFNSRASSEESGFADCSLASSCASASPR